MKTMSDTPEEEGTFLDRWSKRKAAARKENIADKSEERVPQPPADAQQAVIVSDAPEVALADLPSIDEIDAATDLKPWLKLNVPAAWRLAAMRKMWAADPAIAEFIGPSDYAWDWNVPDGVPGFGPLRAIDNIVELVANIANGMPLQDVEIVRSAAGTSMAAAPPSELAAPPPELGAEADRRPCDPNANSEMPPCDLRPPVPEASEYANLPKRGGKALPS